MWDDVEDSLGPGHSILPRRSHARLPSTPAERALPLHVKRVARLDYSYVLQHALPAARERLDSLWALLDEYVPEKDHHSSEFAGLWAEQLLDADIVEAAEDVSRKGLCSAFTVVEEKAAGDRLRFILWPKALNEWLDERGYVPSVPLPATPWDVATAPWGAVCDLTCSFFQIHVPRRYRHLFRFADSFGRIWQMRALPMGLSLSPEIMHSVKSILGGSPAYAKSAWVAPRVTTTAWIDNLQWTGEKTDVEAFLQVFLCRAKGARATLNEEETVSAHRYVFAGILFDHRDHTVALGPKAHGHLTSLPPTAQTTVGELERLLGRLWFAARVLGLPIHHYWWFLKSARRIMGRLNRGLLRLADVAPLPRSARNEMLQWWNSAEVNAPRRIRPRSRHAPLFDLYSDATPEGWGAVCIQRETKSTVILGARWPAVAPNINAAETRAIAVALSELQDVIPPRSLIHVHIDNTSALASVQRCFSKSAAITAELHRLLPLADRYELTSSYIRSAENPADAPSRGVFG